MDCERLREVLIEHVDGLLGAGEADRAREHLASCASCRALQEEVRRNFAALDAWEDEELPAGAFERLVARVPAGPSVAFDPAPAPAPRSWGRLLVPYAAGLATAAAAMALFLVPNDGAGLSPRPAVPAGVTPTSSGETLGDLSDPDPSGRVLLVSTDGDAAPDAPATSTPRRAGRPLTFRVADQGALRSFLLPEGVDPKSIDLIDDERPIATPSGVR